MFLMRYNTILKKSFVKDSFILTLGTSIAQLCPILIYPILGRIYAPNDFGTFATIYAFVSIFAAISTGKYEYSILIADNNQKSANIIVMSLSISVIVLLLITVFLFCFGRLLGMFVHVKVELLLLCPMWAFFVNVFNIYNEWCVRNKSFKRLATNKIVSSTMVSGLKLLCGIRNGWGTGLIWGDILGRMVTAIVCLYKMFKADYNLFAKVNVKEMLELAKRYINFPKYTMPDQLLNTLGSSIPILLLGKYYTTSDVGYYSMTMTVLSIPVNVISFSVRDVFRQKANEKYKKDGDIRDIFLKLLSILSLAVFIISLLVIFFLPLLFKIVLGEQWLQAGYLAQIMLPMIALDFIAMSLSGVLTITEKLGQALKWQICYSVISIGSVLLGTSLHSSMEHTIIILSITKSLVYVYLLYLSYKYTR